MIVDPNRSRPEQRHAKKGYYDIITAIVAWALRCSLLRFVCEGAAGPCWVPCEFDIGEDGSVQLVGGARSHRHPHLAEQACL